MSDDVVIRAEGLGKKYLIGHQSDERVSTLRDAITRSVSRFARSAKDMIGGRAVIGGDEIEEFWALKDVSFEIKRGDVVGIIGRNGAGKSTLLKILSRITEPSEGKVSIKGRVASLLEVGTGFHPELTGRENIFLNGAILGMNRAEIRRKFDEIVAFAEVDRFLDTPVKRYSSGMYVRLAFAVAAHLEPEILIVDEVLAVGDSEFQKKCLGKMDDVAGHGRTVIFVSHNLGAINELCRSAILITNGRAESYKSTIEGIDKYQTNIRLNRSSHGNEAVEHCFDISLDHRAQRLQFRIHINNLRLYWGSIKEIAFILNDSKDQRIAVVEISEYFNKFQSDFHYLDGLISLDSLLSDNYSIDLFVSSEKFEGDIKGVFIFELEDVGTLAYERRYMGVVRLSVGTSSAI